MSTWFQAVNLAEKAHRIRRRREYFLADGGKPQPGGIGGIPATAKNSLILRHDLDRGGFDLGSRRKPLAARQRRSKRIKARRIARRIEALKRRK